jgi:isopenicillin-N epimerase
MKFGHQILNEWYLDENVVFLNHGSFGAAPKVVLNKYFEILQKLEKQPVSFFIDEYPLLITEAARRLAGFVGAKEENLVFVENATTGVNTVLRSLMLELKPGDDILTTNHEYPGIKNTIQFVSEKTGAKIVEADIPFPIESSEQIIDIIKKSLNDKTRIAVFDHVTSPTALIFPVKELIELCRENNTISIIDGAHVPGMFDLNIEELNPDFYTNNCHKWLFTPKGCALLWVNEKYHDKINPLSISLEYKKGFRNEFAWTGTKNPASWLAVPFAIDFYEGYGKNDIMSHNHGLIVKARNAIADELNLSIPTKDNMLGTMATMPFPGNYDINDNIIIELRKQFYNKYRIELPFMAFNNKLWFRISAQIYNEIGDYYKLIDAIRDFTNS